MAIVKQLYLFSCRDYESLENLESLKLALENIPDENLIEMLNLIRGSGRNDNPMCGFDPFSGSEAVPSSSAYSRFLASILQHENVIDAIFHNLVESIRKVLPDFGKTVAFDGKAIES